MMNTSMKKNIDIRYKKVWRRKKKEKKKRENEEQVNEELPEIILSGFAVVQDHDESTGKEEDVNSDDSTQRRLHPLF
jgi:hypothetical protein